MNKPIISKNTDNSAYLNAIGSKLLILLMMLIYLVLTQAHAGSKRHPHGHFFGYGKKVIEVDIVENPRKFSFDETPTFEDGSANAYGAEFITQGFIYPKGTLEMGEGVDAEGNPQFPDLVIGTWFCRGWHVGDGARTTTGPIVITHQLFNFGEKYGKKTITTDGLELADFSEPVKRAITGGTGRYRRAKGEQIQKLEGINQFETEKGTLVGVKLRVKLKVYH